MKHWGLRILSALLTFALGTGTAIIGGRCVKPTLIRPVSIAPHIDFQLPPPIVENSQSTSEVNEEAGQSGEVDEGIPREVYQAIQPRPVSISPYEIKRLTDKDKLLPCPNDEGGRIDFGPIWKRLKLKVSRKSEDFPERCDPQAKASIYPLDLDDEAGNEVLLKLDFGMPEATLYLIFKHANGQDNAGWNLLGSIPYFYGAPFVPPSEKVISDGQHRWLVIDHSTGHGSGFGSGADNWFEVGVSGVRKVLSYQNGLFIGFSNPDVDRDTKVLKCEYRKGTTTVVIQSSTSYGSYDEQSREPFNLWSNKREAVFIKGQGRQKFVFDSRHSAMSAKEFNPYYGYDAEISNRDILKYNQHDLSRIAAVGNEKQKEWLRSFLHARNDSALKQSLQKVLEGARP